MRTPRLAKGLLGAVAVMALAFAGNASAVPCGGILTGGIAPNIGCQNGPAGDTSPSASDLNAGNFFGINNWTLLDSTADGVDSSYWSFVLSNPNGTKLGLFFLADSIWDSFSSLTVVLNGRGGEQDGNIKWSAYLLPENWDAYGWAYDFHNKLTSASLFGVARTVAVPEPASVAIFLIGLSGIVLVLRRRQAISRKS